jgi:hypothetical protein
MTLPFHEMTRRNHSDRKVEKEARQACRSGDTGAWKERRADLRCAIGKLASDATEQNFVIMRPSFFSLMQELPMRKR